MEKITDNQDHIRFNSDGTNTRTGTCCYEGSDAFFLESSRLKAVVLNRGARMASLLDKETGRELMVQTKLPYMPSVRYDGDYATSSPCGFDEMFPTIDACYYEKYPWSGVKMPDHGEVWSLDWSWSVQEDSLDMWVYGVRFPYRLSKRMSFREDGLFLMEYTVSNLSPFDLDCLWSAHAMFAMDDHSRVVLPGDCKRGAIVYSHNALSGKYGDVVAVTDMSAKDGMATEELIRVPMDRISRYMDKFFIKDRFANGWCGVEHPSDGSAYIMRFPVDRVPYLGILLTRGFDIGTCAMLEPCTGAYDRPDRANTLGCGSTLAGFGRLAWHLEIEKLKDGF